MTLKKFQLVQFILDVMDYQPKHMEKNGMVKVVCLKQVMFQIFLILDTMLRFMVNAVKKLDIFSLKGY